MLLKVFHCVKSVCTRILGLVRIFPYLNITLTITVWARKNFEYGHFEYGHFEYGHFEYGHCSRSV